MNSKYELWPAFDGGIEVLRRQRDRRVMGTKELKDRGLFFWPDDVVDLEAFRCLHQVELPDGRRFRTEECALMGLDHQAAALARAFWRAKGECLCVV